MPNADLPRHYRRTTRDPGARSYLRLWLELLVLANRTRTASPASTNARPPAPTRWRRWSWRPSPAWSWT
ncbi:hypothetical protein [Actinomadura kijaniata]|uniref:hypothetical protein n=1 Tax=Actinomadura kijaniata TaxID=46161 RepID=UPI000836DBDC|nr:hypothetical protein [Actinomadura kijaniata]